MGSGHIQAADPRLHRSRDQTLHRAGSPRHRTGSNVKNAAIAIAIALVLGAAAMWGSCAVPHKVAGEPAQSVYFYATPGDLDHVGGPSGDA